MYGIIPVRIKDHRFTLEDPEVLFQGFAAKITDDQLQQFQSLQGNIIESIGVFNSSVLLHLGLIYDVRA